MTLSSNPIDSVHHARGEKFSKSNSGVLQEVVESKREERRQEDGQHCAGSGISEMQSIEAKPQNGNVANVNSIRVLSDPFGDGVQVTTLISAKKGTANPVIPQNTQSRTRSRDGGSQMR